LCVCSLPAGHVFMEGRQPVILIAEDNEDDIALLRRAFTRSGILTPLHYVYDGEETIHYLKGEGKFANRTEFPLPDLLLLDLKMPRVNGFEVIQWVRDQPHLGALRIVVLTTSSDIRDVERAYLLGAHSYLAKPAILDDFKHMIDAIYRYWFAFSFNPKIERPSVMNNLLEQDPL
jgi:CheY-like chemotaxis protein